MQRTENPRISDRYGGVALYYPLVAELVDAPDLGSGAARRAGSSPAEGTIR